MQPLAAVYTSPLERALETAQPIAARHALVPCPVEGLGELQFGDWEGRSFAELGALEDWRRFNSCRGSVRPPGGELMMESQMRMIRECESLARRHPDAEIAVVSHGDPLRSLIAHCLGIPLDLMLRFEISPGSLSVMQAAPCEVRILSVNQTAGVMQ
uniref:Phosphoglycerate mutase n=1 Tax=Solibacter usitatus (strain Ellin6076) TaxID=234267 RepID=Q022V0_SOLUE